MKTLIVYILIAFPFLGFSQALNQKEFDQKRNNEMLVGVCNRDGFKMIRSNFDSAYQAEYPIYVPDQPTVDQIASHLKKIRVKVIMGTWCGDSRDWVPRFYKVMDKAGFDEKNLTLICVDHTKKAPVKGLSELKIDRVPTFIFYKKKKEIGRIIETPSDSMEKDILKILGSR